MVEALPEVADRLVVHLEDDAGGPGELLLFVALRAGRGPRRGPAHADRRGPPRGPLAAPRPGRGSRRSRRSRGRCRARSSRCRSSGSSSASRADDHRVAATRSRTRRRSRRSRRSPRHDAGPRRAGSDRRRGERVHRGPCVEIRVVERDRRDPDDVRLPEVGHDVARLEGVTTAPRVRDADAQLGTTLLGVARREQHARRGRTGRGVPRGSR